MNPRPITTEQDCRLGIRTPGHIAKFGTEKLLVLFILCVLALSPLKDFSIPSLAQTAERTLENKIPKHVPIKVKIKDEREKAFRDLRNEDWVSAFELEVTNTSSKPIYFLELWVVLPEIISQNGLKVGFPLRYGRSDLMNFKNLALPDDVAIKPGEQYVYKIPENYKKGWNSRRIRENRSNPREIEIKFVQLSFGDGSGFNGTDAKPYPYQKDRSKIGCREGSKEDGRPKPFTLTTLSTPFQWYFQKPAAFPPVSFFPENESDFESDLSQPDICCQVHRAIFAKTQRISAFVNQRSFHLINRVFRSRGKVFNRRIN